MSRASDVHKTIAGGRGTRSAQPLSLGWLLFFDYTPSVRLQLNRFLLILMMLALPVQTFASAAMPVCAFSHQGAAVHQDVAKHRAMAETGMADCHASRHQDTSPPQHNCKHCAACYLTSVLPIPTVIATQVTPVPHSVIPHADASFIGFIPDSPERPPRASFA
jgi:hypothetical protein